MLARIINKESLPTINHYERKTRVDRIRNCPSLYIQYKVAHITATLLSLPNVYRYLETLCIVPSEKRNSENEFIRFRQRSNFLL